MMTLGTWQLFKSTKDIILKMSQTRANYWGEFVLDIPVGTLLIFTAFRRSDMQPFAAFMTILLGLFLFSFVEYFFHRWLFHGSVAFIVEGHRAHHQNPLGYDGLPFFLPALVLLGMIGILNLLMPLSYAFLLAGVTAFGYVTYGLSHYAIHHRRFRHHLAQRWAANHHIHHYHSDTNFGVTTPLWDTLLNTRYMRN